MKKSIFIVLTLIMLMVGTVVFGATFSDVKGTKYQDSVELLTDLKIVAGKTTTSYAPNDNVLRSEMAKLLVVAMGKGDEAAKKNTSTKFPDVVENHWARGYINVATELGLIKGYPDGTFAPNDNVSYVEAITMLLRALNYEDADSLSWPNGYIDRGKSIGLVKNVDVENFDDKAIRGDIAILVNNTLLSKTREITGSNDKGMVYGDGQELISKAFGNYEYYLNAKVSDVDDIEQKIMLTDTNNKKHTLKYTGNDILSLYGKEVTALYNKKEEIFLRFSIDSSYKTVSGSVTKVESKKIYIKKVEYTLPASSKIKLVGISSLSDADEAYLTMKNDVVTYVLAVGEEDLYVGLSTTKSSKSGDKYKVTLLDTDGDEESFVLADQSTTIKKGEVVIYSLNDNDEIVVQYHKSEDDGVAVETASKTELKLKGKNKLTFTSNDNLVVIGVADGEISKEKNMTSIDTKYDTALVINSRKTTFVIYFVEGLDDDEIEDENTSATKTIAKKRLNNAIKDADSRKEASYTIASYEKMLVKLEEAEKINQDKATIAAMDKASFALENAIENLEKATTADKTLRNEFSNLTAKIKEAKTLAKNTEYTETSRNALSKVITTAESIKITSTTSAKIQTVINNINDAIDNLVNTATEKELAEIKAEITELLKQAKAKKEADYTKESYSKLKEAITAAEAIKDYSKERITVLKKISNNLVVAMDNLVSHNSEFLEEAIDAYKKQKAEVDKLEKANYTEKSWSELEKYVVDVDDEYKDVEEEKMAEATAEIKELTKNLKQAIDDLVYTEEYEAKKNLKSTIANAKKIKEEDWVEDEEISFAEYQTNISDAEKLLNEATATIGQLEDAEDELKTYIRKYL